MCGRYRQLIFVYCAGDIIGSSFRKSSTSFQHSAIKFRFGIKTTVSWDHIISTMAILTLIRDTFYMGQVTELRLSCCLVLIAKPDNKTAAVPWPDRYCNHKIKRAADFQILPCNLDSKFETFGHKEAISYRLIVVNSCMVSPSWPSAP